MSARDLRVLRLLGTGNFSMGVHKFASMAIDAWRFYAENGELVELTES